MVRKSSVWALFAGIFFLFSSCIRNPAEVAKPSEISEQEMIDLEIVELFERAAQEIIILATEDPISKIQTMLPDVEVIYENKWIDGMVYYETTAPYQELVAYYSQIFTDEALAWILSTKFVEVDGKLYCSPEGGATGWGIKDVQVSRIEIGNDGKIFYEATFVEVYIQSEKKILSHFSIKKEGENYKIYSIDYLPIHTE